MKGSLAGTQFAVPNEEPVLPYKGKQWVVVASASQEDVPGSFFQIPWAAATPERQGFQAEQKEDVGPTCLSLQDPPYTPGEHLDTSLQDILGRISHLFYMVGALQDSEDQTKRLSSQVVQIPSWKAWKWGSSSMSPWQTGDKDSWRTNWRVEWNGLRWKKKLKLRWCSSLCISE